MWYPSAGWTTSGSAGTRIPHHQYSLHNNAPSSRKFLKMDVLTSETCWAVNWHNKASVIKLVYLYSNIKMMHGPICIRYYMFWVCLCRLTYPAWNTYAPYGHALPAPLYHIFVHYLTNGTIFGDKNWTQNMCFEFLHKFCLQNFSFWEELKETWSQMFIGLRVQ